MLNTKGTRWVRACVLPSTASLLALQAGSAATAAKKYSLRKDETISSVARKFHVSVHDIAVTNHLSNPDSVPDFTKLIIPSAPKVTKVHAAMHKRAAIDGDRIAVRLGPGETNQRLTMFDKGVQVTVTAEKSGWAQITLPDGKTGWIRQDFLHFDGQASHLASANHSNFSKHGHANSRLVSNPSKHVKSMREARIEKQKHRKHANELLAKAHKRHHNVELAAAAEHKHHHRKIHLASSNSYSHHSMRHGKRFVEEASAPPASKDIVRTAYAFRGTPYRYGGSGRGGFDCSGFTSYLYRKKGLSLPHSARAQFQGGQHVDKSDMKAGDLVFFHTVTKGISHVGMYVGNGRFVHASSRRSGGVRVDNLNSGYYRERFRGARKMSN